LKNKKVIAMGAFYEQTKTKRKTGAALEHYFAGADDDRHDTGHGRVDYFLTAGGCG
jgi:hypothetical protein